MSRLRVPLIVAACLAAVVAAGFGFHRLQIRSTRRAKASAIESYVTKVGPPTRSLYASWTAYERSIGRPSGSDEDAVRRSRATAVQLQQLLASLSPPPAARLFHDEMSDVAKNILTVIEDRLRLVLSTPQPNERQQIQNEGGNAYYFVKQSFPDVISQLATLERIATRP